MIYIASPPGSHPISTDEETLTNVLSLVAGPSYDKTNSLPEPRGPGTKLLRVVPTATTRMQMRVLDQQERNGQHMIRRPRGHMLPLMNKLVPTCECKPRPVLGIVIRARRHAKEVGDSNETWNEYAPQTMISVPGEGHQYDCKRMSKGVAVRMPRRGLRHWPGSAPSQTGPSPVH